MKKTFKEISKLHALKRNEKLQSGNLYVLSSEACAQNTYFERKRDIVRAHKMIKKHICPIMDVVEYLFTSGGWALTVEVKSEEMIYEYVGSWKNKSKKIATALENKNVSVIISECIRYAISGIARVVNRWNKRLGGLVRCNFGRYVFETVDSARAIMKRMKCEELKMCNQRKRYRPSMAYWNKRGELLENGDVFLSSKSMDSVDMAGSEASLAWQIVNITDHVLRKIIQDTFSKYFGKNSPHSTPKSPSPK